MEENTVPLHVQICQELDGLTHTQLTIDWHSSGPSFSRGLLRNSSSRRTTPKAYTSLLSVNRPEMEGTLE